MKIMWILLLFIIIVGLFYPLVGWIVPVLMIILLVTAFKRKRYFCSTMCPRGSFLSMFIRTKRASPKLFHKTGFRLVILLVFFVLFTLRMMRTEMILEQLGLAFVMICLASTILSVILGLIYSSRTWCVICPMGLVQEGINKIKK